MMLKVTLDLIYSVFKVALGHPVSKHLKIQTLDTFFKHSFFKVSLVELFPCKIKMWKNSQWEFSLKGWK